MAPREMNPDTADAVALARALVATPSVNPALDPEGAGEEAAAAMTAGWLRRWGFEVSLVEALPGRPSVLARLGGAADPGPTLLLNGHLDTVGVAGMTVPPFEARVREGRLEGRGAADMKGGLGALLAAARDASRSAARGEIRGTLLVALTADEEEAGSGGRALAETLTADAAVVCEPTGLRVMPAHKGFTWLDVTFQGRAAHGSRPDLGVDAIRHAGLFLAHLDAVEAELTARRAHPLLGYGSIHAGTITGGDAPSVYPASCTVTVERRTLPGEGGHEALAEVERVLDGLADVPGFQAQARVTLHRDGSEVPGEHPVVSELLTAIGDRGLEPEVAGMTAWVEASTFSAAGIPAVCFGPGEMAQAHAADEWVPVEDIQAAHGVLTTFITRFLA